MGKIFLATNVTVDGYADHTVAVPDDELLDFYTDLLGTVDVVLFGRVTYQLFEDFWPSAEHDSSLPASTIAFARRINNLPKLVASKSLHNVHWKNSTLLKGDLLSEVRKLKEQTDKTALVGGLNVISTLMRYELIDEYWLVIHPIVVGKGKPLFDGQYRTAKLKLVETKRFGSGVVALHYLAKGEGRESS